MKRLLNLFAACIFLVAGCNNSKEQAMQSTTKTDSTAQVMPQAPLVEEKPNEQAPAAAMTGDAKATNELCNCMNDALRGMNPKIRNIIIKAGKSANPELTLQQELLSMSNTDEAQQIAQEFQQLQQNNKVENCSAEIKRKYNLDDNTKAARDKLMKAAAENGNCELVYALMKISVQQIDKGGSDIPNQ